MTAIELKPAEQEAFATAAHTLHYGEIKGQLAAPIAPAKLIEARRAADVSSSLWTTFQRTQ